MDRRVVHVQRLRNMRAQQGLVVSSRAHGQDSPQQPRPKIRILVRGSRIAGQLVVVKEVVDLLDGVISRMRRLARETRVMRRQIQQRDLLAVA